MADDRKINVCNRCKIAGDNIGFNWNGKVGCFNCGESLQEIYYEWAQKQKFTIYNEAQRKDLEEPYP